MATNTRHRVLGGKTQANNRYYRRHFALIFAANFKKAIWYFNSPKNN
jgi:hypothetical protein